jgi:hypothetical protein
MHTTYHPLESDYVRGSRSGGFSKRHVKFDNLARKQRRKTVQRRNEPNVSSSVLAANAAKELETQRLTKQPKQIRLVKQNKIDPCDRRSSVH